MCEVIRLSHAAACSACIRGVLSTCSVVFLRVLLRCSSLTVCYQLHVHFQGASAVLRALAIPSDNAVNTQPAPSPMVTPWSRKGACCAYSEQPAGPSVLLLP
jgi:hypothetical protein